MNYFSKLLFLLTITVFTFSCKTDFDVIARYKEIIVVYGLLDQNDTTHYLRITKAFLGDGNALVYAKDPDSSTLGSELKVNLLEIHSPSDFSTIVFDTVMIHDKDSGIFFSPDQKMYESDAFLDSSYTYVLKIKDTLSGQEVTSSTSLIQNFRIETPKPGRKEIGFTREVLSQQSFRWKSAVNGKRYQPILKFYFKETSNPNDTIIRQVEWILASSISDGIEGGEDMWANYLNEDFYKLCESQIPYSDPVREDAVRVRLADHFNLSFTIVGDEFSTYLDLNGPTTGLLLEKPVYSNINNGIGVFSCHYVWNKSYKVNDLTKADLKNTTNLHFFAD
jgi:hypothetical protein